MKFKKLSEQQAVIDNFFLSILVLRISGLIILLTLMVTVIDIKNDDFPAFLWCLGLTFSWHLLFVRSRIFLDLKNDRLEFSASSFYLLSKKHYRLSEIVSVIVCKSPFKRGYYQLVIEFGNLAKVPIAYSRAEQNLMDVARQIADFSGASATRR